MDNDPTRNVVMFRLGPHNDDRLTTEVTARAADSIRQAWRAVVAEHDARPEAVTGIFSRWQPSTMDSAFINLTFKQIEVDYRFERPKPDDWDTAFADARRVLDAEQEQEPGAQPDHPTREPAVGSEGAVLLPIVHSYSLPAAMQLWNIAPSWDVVKGQVFATIARVAMTPEGKIHIQHVLHDEVPDPDQFVALVMDAMANIAEALTIELNTVDGELRVLYMRREGGLGGSGIALASLHEIVSAHLHEEAVDLRGGTELIAAVPYPEVLVVAPAGSPTADRLRELVGEASQHTDTFRPTLFRVTADGTEVVLEGGTSTEQAALDMASDPSLNGIAFFRGANPDDTVAALAPTRDVDAVQQAWRQVVERSGVRADEVTAVTAEWQPSYQDGEFIAETFPDAPLSYARARPESDGWDAAFAVMRPMIKEAMSTVRERSQTQEELETVPDRVMESTTDGVLLPILRSDSIPANKLVREHMPCWDVVPGKLFATLAYVARTPRGTVGMRHVLNEADFSDGLVGAITALADNLRIEGRGSDDSVTVIQMVRDDFLAGSAIVLPGFHRQALDAAGWEDQIVAITCPDDLFIAPAGSPAADELRRMVEQVGQQSDELRPSLLRVTADGMELIAEGGR